MSGKKVAQFQSFASSPDVSFWHEFAKRKLEVYKLSEEPVEIQGFYTNDNAYHKLPARICLQSSSFTLAKPPPYHFSAPGTLSNCNTIETFKDTDKKQLVAKAVQQVSFTISLSFNQHHHEDLLTQFRSGMTFNQEQQSTTHRYYIDL
jgi:hypothetical protein